MLDTSRIEDANKVLAGVGKPTAISVSAIFSRHGIMVAKRYIARIRLHKWLLRVVEIRKLATMDGVAKRRTPIS